jgi:phosphoribosylformylglycinamidine synthase
MDMPDYSLDVFYSEERFDSQASSVKEAIREDLFVAGVEEVIYIDSYRISLEVSETEMKEVAENVFTDPVVQQYSLNSPFAKKGYWCLEVCFHPDVTDNVAITATEAVSDYLRRSLKDSERISWGRKYLLKGRLTEKEIEKICSGLLANSIIESYKYKKV